MKEELIAPCGMNCGICLAYLREKNRCPGYREDSKPKSTYRMNCVIKNCGVIKTNNSGFCFECDKYPCKRLKQLDKRYRARYSMSMLENLEHIRNFGLAVFVEKERGRWQCLKCGGTICVHRGYCYSCGERPDSPSEQNVTA
jgi:hypothetical protein